MSKVKIEGNASGTGTFTIAAPNSNTDRTFNLPDEAGTVLTSASSIPASSITGLTQGITRAEQWRIVTTQTISSSGNQNITGGFELDDTYSPGSINQGMTESGGTFTFPETGIWLITATVDFYTSSPQRYAGPFIRVTTNNSTYYLAASSYGSTDAFNTLVNVTVTISTIFDVTDTSTHKCRFGLTSENGNLNLDGSSTTSTNSFTFIRLGDT